MQMNVHESSKCFLQAYKLLIIPPDYRSDLQDISCFLQYSLPIPLPTIQRHRPSLCVGATAPSLNRRNQNRSSIAVKRTPPLAFNIVRRLTAPVHCVRQSEKNSAR